MNVHESTVNKHIIAVEPVINNVLCKVNAAAATHSRWAYRVSRPCLWRVPITVPITVPIRHVMYTSVHMYILKCASMPTTTTRASSWVHNFLTKSLIDKTFTVRACVRHMKSYEYLHKLPVNARVFKPAVSRSTNDAELDSQRQTNVRASKSVLSHVHRSHKRLRWTPLRSHKTHTPRTLLPRLWANIGQ